MDRSGELTRSAPTWRSLVNPDGPMDPAAIKIHKIRPADLKGAPRFPMILSKVRDFIGDLPIVAHAYENERDFLDYEFARAKVIAWGDSAYDEERYICTQSLFAQIFPGGAKSLTAMCDRLALDASERDDRHGALLDADMTADALILLEHHTWRERRTEIMDLWLTRRPQGLGRAATGFPKSAAGILASPFRAVLCRPDGAHRECVPAF